MPLTIQNEGYREWSSPSLYEAETVAQVRQIRNPVDKSFVLVAADNGGTNLGIFKFDSASVVADDGTTALIPINPAFGAAGRWILIPSGGGGGGITDTVLEFDLSDETTPLTTAVGVKTWFAPYAFTIASVKTSLSIPSSSGLVTVNIKEAGVTLFSTRPSIDANEDTSVTAATPYVLSDANIADNAKLTFDIDAAGTGAAGLKVCLTLA